MTLITFQYLILASNIILMVLLAVVLYLTKKEHDQLEKGDVIPNEKIISNALLKSDSIIGKAVSKAQDIITVAQSKRLDLVSTEKLISKKIVDSYRADIEKLEKDIEGKFEKNTQIADKSYQEFLNTIENKIKLNLETNQKILDTKASIFIDAAGKSLTDFTAELENRIKSQIEGEMKKANMEIEEYRTHRQKVLDEKIVDILEEVFRLTVDKKLSLSEQSDFIYKALEEAKKNHAF